MPLLSGPLQSRNFRLLVACNAISVTGTYVSSVALPFAVLRIGGSASDVGYVATAGLVPMVAFLLLGGVVADRLPRHQVIAVANALQAASQGTAAVLLLIGHAHVWQLAALAAATGIGGGFYFPAAEGLLPQTVPADQRSQANALDRSSRQAASIGGAALGGVLVAVAGPGWGLAIDAASFAVAGALRWGMQFPAMPPVQAPSIVTGLREGWHEFASRRWLWVIIAQMSVIIAILSATISVLGPLIAHSRLGGATSWGYIAAAYGAGAALGGLAMLRYRPQRMLLSATLSVPAFCLLLLALAVPLPVPLDMLAGFLAGGCLEVFSVNWANTLQQEIPSDRLSRIASYDAFGALVLAPIGTAASGQLVSTYGVRTILITCAVVIVVLTAAVLLVPDVRHMRRQKPPATDPPADEAASSAQPVP